MKKLKLIFTSILFVLIAVSCDNDGGTSGTGAIEAAVPNIRKIASTDQGLNLLALQNGQNINLGLTFDEGFGTLSSVDVIGFYTKNGVTERAVLKTNVTGFPATVNITQTDLYAAFTALNVASDFGLLDKLVISADLKLQDGTVIKMFDDKGVALFGSDIANTTLYAVSQTYTASCPLTDASLFNGNFKITADQWADYAVGTIIPVVYNSADGAFTFRILATKNPYILNASTAYMKVTVNPATNAVTVQSNENFNYGGGDLTAVTGTGTVGSCNGDINLKLNFPGYNQSGFTFSLAKVN